MELVEDEMAVLRERVVEAELRAEAARAGLRDLDALRMLTAEERAGALEEGGAARAVGRLREGKPWLFAQSTSAAVRVPGAGAVARPDAMAMGHGEWRAARAVVLRGR